MRPSLSGAVSANSGKMFELDKLELFPKSSVRELFDTPLNFLYVVSDMDAGLF
jgi:hypothetical protein